MRRLGVRPWSETGSNPIIVSAAIAVTAVVLGFFAVDTFQNAPQTFTAIVAIAVLAVLLDWLTRRGASATAGATATPAARG